MSTTRQPMITELTHTRLDVPGQLHDIGRRLGLDPDESVVEETTDDSAPTTRAPEEPQRHGFRPAAAWILLPAVTALLVLTVPPVRSFAQEVLVYLRDYFFERSTPAQAPSSHNWELLGDETEIVSERVNLSQSAGFPVRSLPTGPSWPEFSSALVAAGERSAVLATYRNADWNVQVLQQTLEDARQNGALAYPLGMSGIANEANIRDVEVGPYSGQQVHGEWTYNGQSRRWRNDWPVNRIRWSDDVFLYTIELRYFPSGERRITTPLRRLRRTMTKEALRLAQGLME